MTTRELAAPLWFGLCCVVPIVYANTSDLPIETALASIAEPSTAAPTETEIPVIAGDDLSAHASSTVHEDLQMLWPMMPKDSLTQLANSFYPDSPILAQRFIQKSVRLSKALGINIDPDVPFQHAQIIAIPNEKEVRALTHRIKKREELLTEQEQLQFSYQLINTSPAKTQASKTKEHVVKSRLNEVPIALEMPEITMPKIVLPKWHAPTLENLYKHFNHVLHNIRAQIGYVWQTGKKTLNGWQIYAIGNQQARIAAFASGLVLFGLLLWWLQRRYQQRKVALLNTIESTLVEPGLVEPTIGELPVVEPNDLAEHSPVITNSEIALAPDISDSSLKASAFDDTEAFLENLSADSPYGDETKPNDGSTMPEQNS